MPKAVMSERKERNDENIKQVKAVLTDNHYQCARQLKDRDGMLIDVWVGGGQTSVIILQQYADDNGFELWVPITKSIRMDDTLQALKHHTLPRNLA